MLRIFLILAFLLFIESRADTTVNLIQSSDYESNTGDAGVTTAAAPPIVDLGYEVHQAVINDTGKYYNFSNIRYAEPPIGQLRFRAPIAPTTINRTVQLAPPPRACFQGAALWQQEGGAFIGSIISGINASLAGGIDSFPATNGAAAAGPSPGPPPPLSGQTDDCLFLDVMVPQAVFDNAQAQNASGTPILGVPVLLWIHGGGHVTGSKDGAGNPAGLLAESVLNNRGGIVYVQINYRLGLFGYPPKRVGDTDTASNGGLLDQRLAMQWIQQNIHLFGGDPNSITVMGESAGANSIMHHITSFGGTQGPLPFQRAILQSPAWRPTSDAPFYERLFDQVIQIAGVETIDDLRNFNSADLQTLNNNITLTSPFETFQFGTNIDGAYIPQAPGVLLAQGLFDQNITLMIAHNSNEGLLFTDDNVVDTTGFESNLAGFLPGATPDQIANFGTTLYPEDFSGAQPYTSQTERLAVAMRDGIVENNAFGLQVAFGNRSFSYVFGQFPGFHAQDLAYTFFTGGADIDGFGTPVNTTVAKIMQSGIIQFTLLGNPNDPNSSGLPDIPVYGPDSLVLFMNSTFLAPVVDSARNSRQSFWLTGLYNQTGFEV